MSLVIVYKKKFLLIMNYGLYDVCEGMIGKRENIYLVIIYKFVSRIFFDNFIVIKMNI